MTPLETLLSYFPTGTTEGERHILRKAFVQADEYADLITPPPFSPRILVGKKGSGKSAIIELSLSILKRTKVPAVLLKPLDIELGAVPETASVAEVARVACTELARAIARVLGSPLSGLLNSEEKILYEEAVASGLKDRDAIERLAILLPKLAKPYFDSDLATFLPGTQVATREKLVSAIKNNLAQSETGFYLFIDDTDQVAAPDRPGHLNRIWGFLLAARELGQKVEQLRCVVSLREEVWRRLTSDRAGQRDQTDHFSGLIRFLNPTREHIRRIVERRIQLAAADVGGSFGNPWRLFFDSDFPHVPTSSERSSWSDLIIVRSRERPRDAVQLISSLAQRAIGNQKEKITEDDFAAEMVNFSKQRVSFLAQEAEYECPELAEIVRSFCTMDFDHGSFKATAQAVRKHLEGIEGRFGITLFGRTIHPNREEDLFQLWRFLFELGFLNARVADNREKDGFRHVLFRDDAGLVSKTRWNDMQAVAWEIDPAYRDHLISVQQDQVARTGLPPSGKRKR